MGLLAFSSCCSLFSNYKVKYRLLIGGFRLMRNFVIGWLHKLLNRDSARGISIYGNLSFQFWNGSLAPCNRFHFNLYFKNHFLKKQQIKDGDCLYVCTLQGSRSGLHSKLHQITMWISFQLEDDALNFTRFKMMGGRLLLKKGVLPHRFECQGKNIERARAVATKRDLQRHLNEALQSGDEVSWIMLDLKSCRTIVNVIHCSIPA